MKKMLATILILVFITPCYATSITKDGFEITNITCKQTGNMGEISYSGEVTNNSGKSYSHVFFSIRVSYKGDTTFDSLNFKISSFEVGTTRPFKKPGRNLRLDSDENSEELEYIIESIDPYNI